MTLLITSAPVRRRTSDRCDTNANTPARQMIKVGTLCGSFVNPIRFFARVCVALLESSAAAFPGGGYEAMFSRT
jgi:hypothetical protein